jgi:O-antigen/teichoic acid export membrane protein
MYTSVVGLVSNLILSYIFLRIFGYFGVVTGTVIALTGSSLLFLVMIHKVLNIRWKTYFRYFLIPLVSIVAGGLAGLFVSAQVGNLLFGTASALLLSLIIYSILLWKLDYFTSEDKQFFSEFIKKIREKIFPSVRTEST